MINRSQNILAAHLGGMEQTIGRAEVSAGLAGAMSAMNVILYSDANSFCKRAIRSLEDQEVSPPYKQVNHDLWLVWDDLVRSRPKGSIQIRKVKAHRKITQDMTFFERWTAHHNNAVDAEAKRMNKDRHAAYLKKQAQLITKRDKLLKQTQAVLALHLDIAEAHIAATEALLGPEEAGDLVVTQQQQQGNHEIEAITNERVMWGCDGQGNKLRGWLVHKCELTQSAWDTCIFGQVFLWRVLRWAETLMWNPSDFNNEGEQGISWAELCLDYCLATGYRPPINLGGKSMVSRAVYTNCRTCLRWLCCTCLLLVA